MKWATILAVATAMICLASVQAKCPDGLVNLGDDGKEVCILFYRGKTTWHNMRTQCKVLGYDLATLTGNLHQKVIAYIDTQPDTDLKDETFWIGGTDEGYEGSWKWIQDNSLIPLGTPHWYPCKRRDEPDGGNDQNYLCLPTPKFYFHSCDGNKDYMGICQLFPSAP